MSRYVFRMPDLGEGTVEAEIGRWLVQPGDEVTEDQVIAEVMTEKAAVEVPAPVSGRVISVTGAPGDFVPVGAELAVFEMEAEAATEAAVDADAERAAPVAEAATAATVKPAADASPRDETAPTAVRASGRVMTSPAIRRRAHDAGVDLASVPGTGPGGRILKSDFEAALGGQGAAARGAALATGDDIEVVRIIGVRRVIAERMSESKRTIPHFTYVEEADVTELDELRRHLNACGERDAALTLLPFVARALVRVLADFPQCNALHDAERGVLLRHRAVHLGIATQTPDGLKVPVVRDAGRHSLRSLAAEIRRVSEAARDGRAGRKELSGSTITITSLGKLGGIVSTPVINAPEVAIVGLNRAVERPVVRNGAVTVRTIMNLSSSFDHRFVDGYDAAAMIQALRERLEHPALLFAGPDEL